MAQFFRLDGQVALVTGAGRGIGAGIARRLHAAGARIAVFDRDRRRPRPSPTSSTDCPWSATSARKIRSPLPSHSPSEAGAAVDSGQQRRDHRPHRPELEPRRRRGAGCLRGQHDRPVPVLQEPWCPGSWQRGYGRIVNVGSIAGKEGNPTLMPYSASKAAVIALSKSLAKELAGKGDITVNAISPAVIRTAILDGVAPATVEYMISKIPMGRTGTIDEVAALVHYLVSPEASFTTGQCYDISGGRATY